MWAMYSSIGQGVSHLQSNSPCQDRTFTTETDRINVVAVADGAGSYAHAEEGAELITREISEFLILKYDDMYQSETHLISDISHFIVEALSNYAKEKDYEFDDLSSTLLAVAIDKHQQTYISLHIGDGIIGINDNNQLMLLSDSQNGDSPNMTFMTTSDNLEQYIRITTGKLSENINGFILLSDGAAHVLFEHKTKLFTKNANIVMQSAISGKMSQELINDFTTNFLVPKCKVYDDCGIALLANVCE